IWLGPGAIEHGAARPRPHAALASDLAFLQYPSGSTGDPKGVMITRDNLAWACSVAAFSLDLDGEERVALVAEVDPARLGGDSPDDLLRKLRLAIAEELDVAVHDLALIEPRSLFKTSSGKIQRSRTRAALEAGELPILARFTMPRPTARRAAFSGADLERQIGEWLAESLGLPDAPQRDVPFRELGLDSEGAIGLSGRIAEALGRPLSPR